MKDRPRPGWPSTGCAHGSAHWPGRCPARSWCAAGRAPAPIGPRCVACAPRPPAAAVSLGPHEHETQPHIPQVTTDELLVRTCMAADQQSLAVQLTEHAPTQAARHQHARFTAQAVLTETRDDLNQAAQMYEQVAERWAQYGHAFEHGQALLGAGRCQLRLHR